MAAKLSPDLDRFARRVVERRLANGMTVLLLPRPGSSTVHFAIAFGVGGVDEPAGRSGIAHLYEHMAFKGTPVIGTRDWPRERVLLQRLDRLDERRRTARDPAERDRIQREFERVERQAERLVVPNELDEVYSNHGARGLNAYTSKDATVYVVSLPANRAALWAAIESSRLKHPVLRQFYRERNVVIEELRRYDDMPTWRLYDGLPMLAFTAHPYRTPIVGWLSDLQRMTRVDLERFFRSRYRPERAVVAVVGDLDPGPAFAMIRREFGSWRPAGAAPAPPVTEEPPQRGERRAVELMSANPLVGMAWPAPTWGHADKPALDALTAVLGRGDSSRLHTALVKRRQVAVGVQATTDFPGERYPNLFVVLAAPRSPHGPDVSERAIEAEIAKLKAGALTRRELDKAVNLLEAELFERLADSSHLAAGLAQTQAVTGDWRIPLKAVARLRALKPADVVGAARTYLVAERRSVLTIASRDEAGARVR